MDQRGELGSRFPEPVERVTWIVVLVVLLVASVAVVATIVNKNEVIDEYKATVASDKTEMSDMQQTSDGLAQNLDALGQRLVRSCRALGFIFGSRSYIQTSYVQKAVRIRDKVCVGYPIGP